MVKKISRDRKCAKVFRQIFANRQFEQVSRYSIYLKISIIQISTIVALFLIFMQLKFK